MLKNKKHSYTVKTKIPWNAIAPCTIIRVYASVDGWKKMTLNSYQCHFFYKLSMLAC